MARGFNLTAELNLRGPNNIRPVIANLRRQLSGINVDVGVRINPRSNRDISDIQQSLNRLNATLQQTQSVASAASSSLASLGRNINNFSGSVNNLPRSLNNVVTTTNNANTAMRQAGRTAQQAADGFEAFGRQSALAIRRFAAFSTVAGVIYQFTNAISSATSDFIDFNKELVRVSQVTDTSLKQLAPLVQTISSLSTGLGVTSKDLISVSSTLAQAGLTARDTEKALRALALSALAPSFDKLNDTVEGSIALMRQFGIGADDLESALGSVNAVAAKFAVEAADLITAIQRTGGVFAAASKGVSEGKDALNEFLAVFTSIRQTTRESAETIATGLRTIFTRIQRSETIDALKEYGITLTDLEGKFVGPYEAVRRLSEGLSRLDPRDLRFSKIVEELGGFRQIGKVIPLIQQFAVAQQALKVAQEGQASLANDAATAQLSIANRLVKVREEFNALVRSIGESSTFQTFIKLSLDLASSLIKLADSAKTVLPALTAIATFRGAAALTRFGAGFVSGFRRQNAGGPVRGFARGGYVPGVGNSDTVPAMLTPGEFVIRKKAVETIGVSNLHSMNRYASGGIVRMKDGGDFQSKIAAGKRINLTKDKTMSIKQGKVLGDTDVGSYTFGGIFLRPTGRTQNLSASVKMPRGQGGTKKLDLRLGSLGQDVSQQLEDNLRNATVSTIDTQAKMIAKAIGVSEQNIDESAVLKQIGFDNILGRLFEGVLSTAGGFFRADNNAAFDFPSLPTNLSGKFGNSIGSGKFPIDAKSTLNADSIRSILKKAQAEIINRNKPTGLGFNVEDIVYTSQLPKGSIKDLLDRGIIAKAGSSKYKILQKGYASGGSVEDTVPALLTPGEFVINKKAASRIGLGRLQRLNKADKIQGFNRGGAVGNVVQKFEDGGNVYKIAQDLIKEGRSLADAMEIARKTVSDAAAKTPKQSMSPSADIDRLQRRAAVRGVDIGSMPTSGTRSSFAQFDQNAIAIQRSQQYASVVPTQQQIMANQAANARQGGQVELSRAGLQNLASPTQRSLVGTYMPTFSRALGAGSAPNNTPSAGNAPARGGVVGRGMSSIGSRMGGMGAVALTMAGGMAVDTLAKSMGGEKTNTGRTISSVGSQALNYGASGAMIGSMFGPIGTALGGLVGATAGVIIGFQDAEKAGKEYAQAQAQAAADLSSERSGKSLDRFLGDQTAANRQSFLSDMKATTAAEAVAGGGITREKASFVGRLFGYKDEDARDTGKRRAKTQQAGADQAEKFLAAEMMRSGKTFKELSQSMNPAEFKMLATNIAEADETYATVQSMRANEIEKLRAAGKDAEANALQASANKELEGLATQIAERKLAEEQAAAMAKKQADAQKQLVIVTMRAVLSLEKTFQSMDQALNAVTFSIESAASQREEMLSGKASLTSNNLDKDINILQNPNAYSASDRASAVARSTAVMGSSTGSFVNRVANFSSTARDAALQRANAIQSAGAMGGDILSQNTEIGNEVTNTLINQIKSTFGTDSAMAQTLINGVRGSVEEMVRKANQAGESINPEELVDAAAGPLIKASEKAGELQIKALQAAQKGLMELGKTAEAVANLQQKQLDRTNNLKDMQRNSVLAFDEVLGKKITPQDRINNRMQGVADRLGMVNGQTVTAAGIAQQRAAAVQEQQRLQGQIAAQEKSALGGDPAALRQLGNFQKRLAEVNNTIANTDRELDNLPQTLEANLGDLLNEIQKRVGDIEARKEAGANFAERLVTSTPQEIAELNTTYSLLNRTLSGNIETINQSRIAQQSYYDALVAGKTQQEAFADAQAAFANENKKALSLFNDLTQMSGVKGEQFDRMRADLLVNFAKSQGLGMENNPIFQKVISELRKSSEQRAKDDPGVKAMLAQAAVIREEQRKAVQEQNAADRQLQNDLLKKTGEAIIKSIQDTKLQVQVAVQKAVNAAGAQAPIPVRGRDGIPVGRQSGGIVYASQGQLIHFQPKGTDTVPAMLTPGEFVVNAKATRKNLPLLKQINSGYYAVGGQVNSEQQLLKIIAANQQNRSVEQGLTPDTWAIVNKKVPYDANNTLLFYNNRQNPTYSFGEAAKTKANNSRGATLNLEQQYPWYTPENYKIVSGSQIYSALKGDMQRLSPADKYIQEILYQTNKQPDILSFKQANLKQDTQDIIDQINRSADKAQTAQILYNKATTRKNYLQETLRNLSIASNVIEDAVQGEFFGGKKKIKSSDKEFKLAINQAQLIVAGSRKELAYIDKIWESISEQKKDLPPLVPSNVSGFSLNDFPRAQWFASGGPIYARKGTLVNYQPRGTDTVPAMLTPGEFVVNKKAAQANLPLLQSLNSGHYASGGTVAYLASGTPGTSELTNNLRYLTEILKSGADTLNKTFAAAVDNLNKASSNLSINTPQRTNGVSNNTANPAANIDMLGSKLDRFIEQLQASIPSVIKVEGEHQVNVVINGASILQSVLSGPIGNIVQQAIQSAFDAKSRKNEGN